MARDGARTFVLRFLGDEGSAVNSLRRLHNETGKLDPVNKVGTKAIGDLSSMLTSRLGPAAGVASQAISGKFVSALESIGPAGLAAGAGIAVGGAALVKFAVNGARSFVELAAKVRDFERASGASADTSSRFVAVADDMEVSSDALAKGVFKLGREIAGNRDELEAHGVAVATSKDGTVDLAATLVNVAKAYASAADQTKRNELTQLAFGRAGRELIPILEQGGRLAELFANVRPGEILNESDVRKARELELAADDLGDAWRALGREAGQGLVPIATDLANATAQILDAINRFGGGVHRAAETVADFAGIGEGVDQVLGINKLLEEQDRKNAAAGDKKRQTDSERAAAARQLVESAQDEVDANRELLQSTTALASSALAVERSGLALERAHTSEADAARAVTDAVTAKASADDRLTTAQDRARTAQERLTDARKDAVSQLRDLDLANRENALSEQGAADAVQDAQQDIFKAKTAGDRRDAERSLERAKLAQERQRNQTGDDAARLADAQQKGVEGSDPVKAALEDQKAAEQAVTDAKSGQLAASRNLREAEFGVSEAALATKAAYLEVAEQAGKRKVLAEEASGQVLDAEQKEAEAFKAKKQRLEELAATLAPGSPLRTYLSGVLDDLKRVPLEKLAGPDFGTGLEGGAAEPPRPRRPGGSIVAGGPGVATQPNITVAPGAIQINLTGNVSDAQRREIEASVRAGLAQASRPGGDIDRSLGG